MSKHQNTAFGYVFTFPTTYTKANQLYYLSDTVSILANGEDTTFIFPGIQDLATYRYFPGTELILLKNGNNKKGIFYGMDSTIINNVNIDSIFKEQLRKGGELPAPPDSLYFKSFLQKEYNESTYTYTLRDSTDHADFDTIFVKYDNALARGAFSLSKELEKEESQKLVEVQTIHREKFLAALGTKIPHMYYGFKIFPYTRNQTDSLTRVVELRTDKRAKKTNSDVLSKKRTG